MRVPRNRRKGRRDRKHSKKEYVRSCIIIQNAFRRYLKRRYSSLCSNYADDECIMLEPVHMIPRGVLMVIDRVAFDCRHLLSWMEKSNSHPLSRTPLQPSLKEACVEKVVVFLKKESSRISNSRGFFSRKRVLERILDRHEKIRRKIM